MKKILVIGDFHILHPGHIRLLKFAKDCGDKLIVAINADAVMQVKSQVHERNRLEMVRAIECVDDAFITHVSPSQLIKQIKPYAVVKGKEFESQNNSEQEALDSYDGKLIFGSGEFEIDSEQFVKSPKQVGRSFDYNDIKQYAKRHKITYEAVERVFKKIKELSVAIIGEVIVDEYVQGTAVGLSQEDPTIVLIPNKIDTFLGGAAITAGHIKSIGAKDVTLLSVLGADAKAKYVNRKIRTYNVNTFFCEDVTRPTPLKTRYRADTKTLLRVNEVKQHNISKELQDKLFDELKKIVKTIDILVFSDFNYGILPQSIVERITHLCKESRVKIVADSQTSSQIGDISRYKDTYLMTPTEKEVRVSLHNKDDGLVILAKKLCEKSTPRNLVITLAGEGIFIHVPNENYSSWKNDKIPAINKNPVDPAGAGDCFLATSALCLAAGADPWQSFYLASIAAACQVDCVGNIPLKHDILVKAAMESFN